MPANNHPRQGSPLSIDQLRKSMGGKSDLFEFLSLYAHADVNMKNFQFTSAADFTNADYWTVAKNSGTGNANFVLQVASGGYIQADTGTGDNDSVSLVGPIIYSGDENCGMEIRVQTDDITSVNFEIGFIDAVPGSDGSGVSNIDTPALTANDAALIQLDTDRTITTLAFATDGSTASQDAAATTFAAPAGTNMVNATWHTFRIQLVANFAVAWFDGILAAVHDAGSTQSQGALEGGVLLAPWIYWRTRDTTASFPKISQVSVWQDVVA